MSDETKHNIRHAVVIAAVAVIAVLQNLHILGDCALAG